MTAAEDDFDAYAGSPETWGLAARRNWHVAQLLLEQAEVSARTDPGNWERFSGLKHAGYLHAGLALENAAKRIIVARTSDVVSGGRIRKDAFGSRAHAVVELLELLEWPLSPRERTLAAKLEQFVVWAGKYASPLGSVAMDSPDKLDLLRNSTANESDLIAALVVGLLEVRA